MELRHWPGATTRCVRLSARVWLLHMYTCLVSCGGERCDESVNKMIEIRFQILTTARHRTQSGFPLPVRMPPMHFDIARSHGQIAVRLFGAYGGIIVMNLIYYMVCLLRHAILRATHLVCLEH